MTVVTDPVLREDPLWLALDRAKTAVSDDKQMLINKDHGWEGGLNSKEINRLASAAGFGPRPVFEERELVQGNVKTDRWLKVHHPDIDEPVEVPTWMLHGVPTLSDAKVTRIVEYLELWQQKRAKQLKPYTLGQLIRELSSSEAAYLANSRVAERQEAQSPLVGHWFRIQAEVLRFQLEPDEMPGIRRIEAICDAEWGMGLTLENVRKMRGRLCLGASLSAEQVDGFTLDEAADAWKSDPTQQGAPTQSDRTASSEKRFLVALSFSGERRSIVKEVAEQVASSIGSDRVLYDEYYKAEFARPDLDTYLQRLYHNESELIVVFLCSDYDRKEWCGLEWRAIRDIIKRRRTESVMLFRFDNTEIPGLFSTDGYVWIGDQSAKQLSQLILQRLGSLDPIAGSGTATPESPGELEKALRALPRVAAMLNHARNRHAAEAAVLYFCRGVDNPVERNNPTKTWRLVEQAYLELGERQKNG